MSIVLALETSTELASVALLHAGQLLSREARGVQSHSQTVLPMARALLAEAGLSLQDCDVIAFGCGPGSFTGVRTACGLAQGLAFGAGLPVVPVVTLEAMAHACHDESGASEVLAVLDARMNEVYWAQYRFDNAWIEVTPPALSRPDEVKPVGSPVFIGNGLPLCPGMSGISGEAASAVPHARAVAMLGAAAFQRGQAVQAIHAQPLYLRNKVALTTAERLARTTA